MSKVPTSIIIELPDNNIRITAKEGYVIYDKRNSQEYSEIVVNKKQVKYFAAKEVDQLG